MRNWIASFTIGFLATMATWVTGSGWAWLFVIGGAVVAWVDLLFIDDRYVVMRRD